MDENQFWKIIEESKRDSNESKDAQEEKLRTLLDRLDVVEIAAFDRIFDEMRYKSYTWDLWGAAYIIDGGCSDDGFEYFRRGLIAAGREKFEAALRDAESLADWAEADEVEFEGIQYVIYDAYRAKTGTKDLPKPAITRPNEPAGESWNEDGDDLERRFPRLWEQYGG